MKFAAEDEHFLTQRKVLSEEWGDREFWSLADHWPLFCGIANLGRFMAISDLLRSTLSVPGHIAEFGSWRGANVMLMTKLLHLYDPHSSKLVHCFDSFEGLTTISEKDGNEAEDARNSYRGNYEELLELIRLFKLEDSLVVHKGLIQDTLPAYIETDTACSFSFIYCDTDLFEPSDQILRELHPRLSKGGLFVFDQWNYPQWPGETLAVKGFLKDYGEHYQMRHVSGARQPSLVLEKTTF